MSMRLVEGRLFNGTDRFSEGAAGDARSPGRPRRSHRLRVRSLERSGPASPAIGQALWFPDLDSTGWREVVGVMDDVQFRAVGEAYQRAARLRAVGSNAIGPAAPAGSDDRERIGHGANRESRGAGRGKTGTRVDHVATLETLVSQSTSQPRFTSRVVAAFGALAAALVLAAVGYLRRPSGISWVCARASSGCASRSAHRKA